jgi:hypothetical protein
MEQPRDGLVAWRRVRGGRALPAITHSSWPAAVCGITAERWLSPPPHRWSVSNHRHCVCDKQVGPGRINFWAPDYEEGATHE